MLRWIAVYLAVFSAMKAGAALFAWMNSYDAGRASIRKQVYAPGDDLTTAVFHAIIGAVCIAALVGAFS